MCLIEPTLTESFGWLVLQMSQADLCLWFPSQAPSHPFTDLLSLSSNSSPGANLLVDVFSDNSAPPSVEVSEENFHRYCALFLRISLEKVKAEVCLQRDDRTDFSV